MKTVSTRTLNPLPFGDLEPHRFEDLVRQLAHEFRSWKSLEATGRGGSDDGIDIRGIELLSRDEEPWDGDEEENANTSFLERLWVFQCKREKTLTPKKLRKVVDESLASLTNPPHGFVLAVACDVSKTARDVFREEMVSRGIEEFLIWAKGELEDLLFQPRNDSLLFAYFGIALQPRRRSMSTSLRSEIAKKKQITTLIEKDEQRDGKLILLRDPTDERYPYRQEASETPPRWTLCRALTLRKPGFLVVLHREHLAATNLDGTKWDAILDYDSLASRNENELRSQQAWNIDQSDSRDCSSHNFWNEYISESHRAYLKICRVVPLERILALDPLGDGYFPVPHILVEFDAITGPFTRDRYPSLERIYSMGGEIDIDLADSNRVRIFPDPLPAESDPIPKGFDDTIQNAKPLSILTRENLQVLLTKVAERKLLSTKAASEDSARARDKEIGVKVLEFQVWCRDTAQPAFSSFVQQLRAAGHRARVVIRSSLSSDRVFESIELRAQIHGLYHHNPSYLRPGHLRISFSPYA